MSLGTLSALLLFAALGPAQAREQADAVVATLMQKGPAALELKLSPRFSAERAVLLDPAAALPAWHRYPYGEAKAAHAYLSNCDEAVPAQVDSPALRKALRWRRYRCAGESPPTDFLRRGPLIDPWGRSYAALAGGDTHREWRHAKELVGLDDPTPEERLLGALTSEELAALHRRDRRVLTASHLWVREVRGVGPAAELRYRAFAHDAWRRALDATPLRLVTASSGADCLLREGTLCWIPRPEHGRWPLRLGAVAGVGLLLGMLYLGWDRWRTRRRAAAERQLVLQTLTHELRTPVTALGLHLEALRQAYDDLPPALQSPLLGAGDQLARLRRTLELSGRYLSVQRGEARQRSRRSVNTWASALGEEWPEVELCALPDDRELETDFGWLSLCVSNLLDNAFAHGAEPVRLELHGRRDRLSICVHDAGAKPSLELAAMTAPFRRGDMSKGLGLGLCIVREATEALGGRLTYATEPTRFTLEIPELR